MSKSESPLQLQAQLLKALAHPARLAVMNLLRQQPLTVQQMQDMTALPQAKLSQHLQILRTEQVVMAVRSGKNIKYRLTHPDFLRATELIGTILAQRQTTGSTVSTKHERIVAAATALDPVCGMTVHPATAALADSYKGTMLYFCGRGCLQRWQRQPERYVQSR